MHGLLCLREVSQHRSWKEDWSTTLTGAAGVIAGLIAFFWPDLTALALLYVIAAWAIVLGAGQLALALRYRRQLRMEWLLFLSGAVSVVFGVVIALFPGEGALSLLWVIGIFAIFLGANELLRAFFAQNEDRLGRARRYGVEH